MPVASAITPINRTMPAIPSTRSTPPSNTASGGSARLTARSTRAASSITIASAPTMRIHASHGMAMAPHAMSAVATSMSGIGNVSAMPSNLFARSGGMKSGTTIDARQNARNSESSRKHAARTSAVRVSHFRGVGARSSHGPRWVIPMRSKNTRPSISAPTNDAIAYATVISRNHSGRNVTDAPIAFSWLAIDRARDRGDRPVRGVARRVEETGGRAREISRGTIEHRAEVITQVTQQAVGRGRRRAPQRWIDLGAREGRGHAEERRERAYEDACGDTEERDQDDREEQQVPALEDRTERLEEGDDLVHRPVAFNCSTILSTVVAAHGRKTGARAFSVLNVVSQSRWPLP